jgi:lipopolysaccharide biosynthesis glycosyltransferase
MLRTSGAATDEMHVVLAVYDPSGEYSRHAGVVMASIFDNTRSPVCVHILHDGTMTEQNRELLGETARSFGQRAEFHDVSSHMEKMGANVAKLVGEVLSIGTMFRLLIPEIIPVDRVIYLDSDVVADMDIRDLWEVPLDGFSLAGVTDRPADNPYRRFSAKSFGLWLMGCDRTKYINAGVLLMNLSRIREKFDLPKESAAWCERCGRLSGAVDQDLLNSRFRDDIKIIDARFNRSRVYEDGPNSILHATCQPKPWNALQSSRVDRLYWKYFFKTPWGRLTPEEIAGMMIDISERSSLTHRRSRHCYGTIRRRWLNDIVLNDAIMIIILCVKFLRGMAANFFAKS